MRELFVLKLMYHASEKLEDGSYRTNKLKQTLLNGNGIAMASFLSFFLLSATGASANVHYSWYQVEQGLKCKQMETQI